MGRRKKPYSMLRPDSYSPFFRIRWRDTPWRSTRSLGTNDEEKAKQLAADLYREKLSGKKHMTLRSYAENFFAKDCQYLTKRREEGYEMPKKTIAQHRSHLLKYIIPQFGDSLLEEIKPRHFEIWRRGLALSNATRNHIRNTFKIVMGQAVYDELIPTNPIALTRQLSKRVFKERDIFTSEELSKLFPVDEMELARIWGRPDWALLFNVLATTGIRSGEVRALTWDRICWNESAAFIDRAIKCDGELGSTKTGKCRVVLLPERVVTLLKDWKARSIRNNEDDYIFSGMKRGQPLTKESIVEKFHIALSNTGINTDRHRNLVPHSLRHSFISKAGNELPPSIVNMISGHSSEQMRMRYTHTTRDDLIELLRPYRSNIERMIEK